MKAHHVYCFFAIIILVVGAHLTGSDAREVDSLMKLMKEKMKGNMRSFNGDDKVFEMVKFVDLDKVVLSQNGLKKKDKITKLPGQPDQVGFDQYGGYVTIDDEAGRALFYYFVEADVPNPSSEPLMLWLNGGPGCSSLGYGAMEELGPFRVKSDGRTLYKNKYAWNKVANVLFLESPAGVGFSYSNTTSDYDNSGDQQTAMDAYVFLVNWLERFPEYKNRDFFIAGESYAGHYVPQLAHNILQQNKLANKTIINLQGVTIGNAVINDETDSMGMYDYFWTHALISDETIDRVHKYCDFSPNATVSSECNLGDAETGINVDPIDIYNIYAPLCFSPLVTVLPKRTSLMRFDPCSDYYVQAYLNLPQVQEAFHANVTKLNYPWSACSDLSWNDSPPTILPLLQEFIDNGLRVWVYSGDTDGRVPVTSTRYSLKKLNLPLVTQWQPWYFRQEVGGYTVEYEGLTFATVRGAGHEVPSYHPPRALALITHFLNGNPLPSDG